jgi:hypothetical protein
VTGFATNWTSVLDLMMALRPGRRSVAGSVEVVDVLDVTALEVLVEELLLVEEPRTKTRACTLLELVSVPALPSLLHATKNPPTPLAATCGSIW